MANEKNVIIGFSAELDEVTGVREAAEEIRQYLEKDSNFTVKMNAEGQDAIIKSIREVNKYVQDEEGRIKKLTSYIANMDVGNKKFSVTVDKNDKSELNKVAKQIERINRLKEKATSKKIGLAIDDKESSQYKKAVEAVRAYETQLDSLRRKQQILSNEQPYSISKLTEKSDYSAQEKKMESYYKKAISFQEKYDNAVKSGADKSANVLRDQMEKQLQLARDAQKTLASQTSDNYAGSKASQYEQEISSLNQINQSTEKNVSIREKILELAREVGKIDSDIGVNKKRNNASKEELKTLEERSKMVRKINELSHQSGNYDESKNMANQERYRQRELNNQQKEYDSLSRILKLDKEILSINKELYNEQQKNSQVPTDARKMYVQNLSETVEGYKSERSELEKNIKSSNAKTKADKSQTDSIKSLNSYTLKQNSDMNDTTNIMDNFRVGLKDATARVLNYTLAYRALWGAMALVKKAIADIADINKAMVDIQLVTGETQEETTKLEHTYAQMADTLGATTKEITAGASEWLRQGKSVEETNQLIEQSMILSKVGAVDSADATEYLTAIMNGYGMEASSASHITDALAAVDLKAATSAGELAVALQRSANSGAEAGVSFEKLTSWIATVSETTRRSASTVGESMKTIISRFQSITAGKDIDDMGEPLNDVEEVLSKLDIQLRNSDNSFRNLGDVMDEIGGKWETLGDLERAQLTTAIAGTRQRNNALALFDNYNRALELEGVALNSNGMATEKMTAYTESLEAAQNRLNTAFSDTVYSDEAINSYKIVLDTLTAIVKMIDGLGLVKLAMGGIVMLLAKLVGGKNGLMAFGSFSQMLVSNKSQYQELYTVIGKMNKAELQKLVIDKDLRKLMGATGQSVNQLNDSYKKNVKLVDAVKTNTQGMAVGFSKVGVAIKGVAVAMTKLAISMIAITAIQWIFEAIGNAINAEQKAIEEHNEKMEELNSTISETTSQIESLQSEYDALTNKNSLTESEQKRLDILKAQLAVLQAQNKEAQQKKYEESFSGSGEKSKFTDTNVAPKIDLNATRRDVQQAKKDIQDYVGVVNTAKYDVDKAMEDINSSYDKLGANHDAVSQFDMITRSVEETRKEQEKLIAQLNELDGTDKKTIARKQELIDEINNLGSAENRLKTMALDTYNQYASDDEMMSKLTDTQKEYLQALFDVTGGTINLVDEQGVLIEQGSDIQNSLDEQANKAKTLTEIYDSLKTGSELIAAAWEEMSDSGQLSLETVIKMLESGDEMLGLLQKEGDHYVLNKNAALDYFETLKQGNIANLQQQKADLEAQIADTQAKIVIWDTLGKANANTIIENGKIGSATVDLIAVATQAALQAMGVTNSEAINAIMKSSKKSKELVNMLKGIQKGGGSKGLQKQLEAQRKELDRINTSIDVISNISLNDFTNSTKKATSATDAMKDATQGLRDELQKLKDDLADTKSAYEAIKKAVEDLLEKEIEALEKEKELIEDKKDKYEQFRDLVVEWYDDQINKEKELQDQIKETSEAQLAVSQAKLDALEKEKDETDKLKEMEEARLEVEKAQKALDDAKSRRGARVYRAGAGWTYEADAKEVKDAEDNLTDAQKKYQDLLDEWNFDKQKQAIQDQMDAISAATDQMIKDIDARIAQLEKEKEAWDKALKYENEELKNRADVIDWFKKYESASYDERMAMLKNFDSKYKVEVYDALKTMDDQIAKLKDLKEQWSKSMDISEDLSKYQGAVEFLKKFENASYSERINMLAGFTSSWKNYYSQQTATIDAMESKLAGLENAYKNTSNAAGGAIDAMNRYNGMKMNHDVLETKIVFTSSGLSQVTIYKDGTSSSKTLVAGAYKTYTDGYGNKQEEFKANGGMNTTYKYATGGLMDDNGESGLINYTGPMKGRRNTWVDGTPSYSELMLNNQDASKLWRFVQSLPEYITPYRTSGNGSEIITIGTLNAKVESGQDLKAFIESAKQQARIKRRT